MKEKKSLTEPTSESEKAITELKKHIEANSEDVGSNFAMIARQIHSGEEPERNIHGKTSFTEAKSLRKMEYQSFHFLGLIEKLTDITIKMTS